MEMSLEIAKVAKITKIAKVEDEQRNTSASLMAWWSVERP